MKAIGATALTAILVGVLFQTRKGAEGNSSDSPGTLRDGSSILMPKDDEDTADWLIDSREAVPITNTPRSLAVDVLSAEGRESHIDGEDLAEWLKESEETAPVNTTTGQDRRRRQMLHQRSAELGEQLGRLPHEIISEMIAHLHEAARGDPSIRPQCMRIDVSEADLNRVFRDGDEVRLECRGKVVFCGLTVDDRYYSQDEQHVTILKQIPCESREPLNTQVYISTATIGERVLVIDFFRGRYFAVSLRSCEIPAYFTSLLECSRAIGELSDRGQNVDNVSRLLTKMFTNERTILTTIIKLSVPPELEGVHRGVTAVKDTEPLSRQYWDQTSSEMQREQDELFEAVQQGASGLSGGDQLAKAIQEIVATMQKRRIMAAQVGSEGDDCK